MATNTPTKRHPQKALNARALASKRVPGRYADGGGLYLFVAPSGSRSWVLRIVIKGKRSDLGLGSVSLISLAEARDEAHRLRRIARAGGDPLVERHREKRTIPTFEAAARKVHEEHGAAFKNAKHRKQWLSSLAEMFSGFGGKRVDAVTSADVLSALTPAWTERPETSRRVLQRVRVVFEWCRAHGYCTGDNPTQGLTKVLPRHRAAATHHAALPFQQVPAFLQTLRTSGSGESVALAFELMILSATRTSETLRATWAEIDLDGRVWTIPASRMKAGIEHRVPLSTRCVEILSRAKDLSGGKGYVFPGRTADKPLSNMVFLMALRRLGRADVTAHGFRSSFRDWSAERTNAPRAVCEAALAHTVRDKTEAAYNRTDLFERRRELMATWAAFATAKPADVVALRA